VLAEAAGFLLAGGPAARAGCQTIDMSGFVNVPV
jgi:hypothetical protein